MLKVEIGGGSIPREGFINVDHCATADVIYNLELLETVDQDGKIRKLPFEDDSVDELYTSHCLEHIRNMGGIYHEILRICKVGARVEIRVPHPHQQMAMCADHKHTIGKHQVNHWTRDFIKDWSANIPKKLTLVEETYIPGDGYTFWKRMLPNATHEEITAFCPDGCHESRWVFVVQEWKR